MVADNMNRLVIRANETSTAVSITIIDDNWAEDKLQPSLTVRARVDHTPISQFFTRTITILDDESEITAHSLLITKKKTMSTMVSIAMV